MTRQGPSGSQTIGTSSSEFLEPTPQRGSEAGGR